MKKGLKWVFLLALIGFVAACDTQTVKEKKPEIIELEKKIEEGKIFDQIQPMLQTFNENNYYQYEGSLVVDNGTEQLTKDYQGQENYQEGKLNSYYIQTQVKEGNQSTQFDFYGQKDKGYIRSDGTNWQTSDGERLPDLLVSYLNLMVEGEDQLDLSQEGQVKKEITDKDQLRLLPSHFDWPIAVEEGSIDSVSFTMNYDPKSFQIKKFELQAQVDTGGSSYQLNQIVQIKKAQVDAIPLDVDLNSQLQESVIDSDSLLEAFKKANLSKVYYTYGINFYHQMDESLDEAMAYVNYLASDNLLLAYGEVKDKKVEDLRLYTKDLMDDRFGKDLTAFSQKNYYDYFVNYFIDHFDDFKKVDEKEDQSEEDRPSYYSYRYFVEDNLEDISQIGEGLDLSFLEKPSPAIYGLDLMIDKVSGKLVSVIFWSATGQEEQVQTLYGIHFSQFNAFNPNNLVIKGAKADQSVSEEAEVTSSDAVE